MERTMASEARRGKIVRTERLRRNADFRQVYRASRSLADRPLVLYYRANGLERSRVGFAVGRKVGKAVVRNRVRRRLREALRLWDEVPGGLDLVVVARGASREASFQELQESLRALIKRAAERRAAGERGPKPGTGGKSAGQRENK
jgi:ribonuclease P protein component